MKGIPSPRGFKQKPISLLVAMALPVMINAQSAQADCSGTIASPNSTSVSILCNNSGATTNGNLTVSDSATYVDTANAGTTSYATGGAKTLIQFDGHGRTLTVQEGAQLSNFRNVAGNRIAVFMGQPTVNGSASTTFSTAPTAGSTVVRLGATPSASWIGQSLVVGRYTPADGGDFIPGTAYVITAVDTTNNTVTLASPLSSNFASGDTSLVYAYAVISNYGQGVNKSFTGEAAELFGNRHFYNNVVDNSGTISARIQVNEIASTSTPYTSGVYGIRTSVAGDYLVDNNATGVINVTSAGMGTMIGVEAGGTVTRMDIRNAGEISAVRNLTSVTPVTSTSSGATASSSFSATAVTLNQGNAIQTQEELDTFNLLNTSTGVIRTRGDYTGTIYMRADDKTIVNDGLIEHLASAGGIDYSKGFAIGSVSDSGEIRTLELTNNGTIHGDILAVNGNALRYYLLSTVGDSTSTLGTVSALNAGLISRLSINNQWGQSDSTIVNNGTVVGNLYLSNGNHQLTNSTGATWTGNIDLDQRDTTCASCTTSSAGENTAGGTLGISSNWTVVGSKQFEFENAGTFNGNLTLRTASSSALGGANPVVSSITLIPTIYGAGQATADSATGTGIHGMGNTLNIVTSAGANESTVTIKPQIASGVSVVDGQFYKLANTFQINSSNTSSVPTVKASNSWISWTASVNSSNALVLKSAVNNATAVQGVSGNSANALNTLVKANNPLFSTIANMDSDSKVAQAAQSLLPEVNGASVSAAQKALGSSMQIISNRNSAAQTNFIVGLSDQSGVATGDAPNDTGVWVQGVGFTADQDKRKQADGYQVNAYGMALGMDKVINADNNLRLGAAFTYTNSSIDAKGSNKGDTVGLGSYLGSLYASANMGNWYLNGSLIAGQHRYDSKRVVVGNAVRGSYDANQYGINAEAGMPIKTNVGTLIPLVSGAYNYLDIDGYSERGTGGLKVSGERVDSFRTGLGARMLFPIYKNNSFFELRGIWFHEFADNRFDTTGRFTTGGSSFKTAGVTQARDSANFGASLKLMGDAGKLQQSLLLTYDGEVKDQYLGHTGSIQVRLDF